MHVDVKMLPDAETTPLINLISPLFTTNYKSKTTPALPKLPRVVGMWDHHQIAFLSCSEAA